eukprot:NODE_570_length_1357_cov_101.951220_g532_i0.p1 GENE.NODE_570_length_1357_cov_101.951220_g532_i0~~NODE_570_length_1357_cov_101.951220_g532_i0.p1  ORF type:complete len:441 (+),score=58.65 NODE_570_length_1357_cov_101.951220_g532_i0:62-1324(+)
MRPEKASKTSEDPTDVTHIPLTPSTPYLTPRQYARKYLLPIIRSETPFIVWVQKYRTPVLDVYFQNISILGSHVFYMIGLPTLFWLSYVRYARQLTMLMALGLYWCNFFKDLFCLPRPSCPPVTRMSKTHLMEFGFPSSHTVNALNLPLFTYWYITEYGSLEDSQSVFLFGACAFFTINVCMSRVYMGMHSVIDVLGGMAVGLCLVVPWWYFHVEVDDFMTNGGQLVPLWIFLVGVVLVLIYPDPLTPTPSFDDGVSFVWVMVGVTIGSWHFSTSPFSQSTPFLSTVPYAYRELGFLKTVGRELFGVVVILLWRIVAKKTCLLLLPPIFRVFHFPSRKWFVPARFYDNASRPVPVVPSIVSEHPDPVSDKDFHTSLENPIYHRVPRYDVEVLTRCVVYAGIGWWAVEGIPVLFGLSGLSF